MKELNDKIRQAMSVTHSLGLRRARRSDVPALTALRSEAIRTLAAEAYGSERARGWAESSTAERVRGAIDQHEVWLVEHEDTAAGWVEIDRDRVSGIYVHPDFAGAGVGKALLLHAEGSIRTAGHASVALDSSLNAEGFYLRCGYQAQGGRSESTGVPMRKRLLPLKIDAVCFDADGVVQRADSSWPRRVQAVLGCRDEELDAWQQELFQIEKPSLAGSEDFEPGVRAFLAERGCPGSWESFLGAWTAIEVDAAVVDLVRKLRAARTRCFLASNQQRHRADWMSRELGFGSLFDAEFYSYALGVTKPGAAFFEQITARAKLHPATTLFLDDRLVNVVAARKAGMHAQCVEFGSVVEVVERFVG